MGGSVQAGVVSCFRSLLPIAASNTSANMLDDDAQVETNQVRELDQPVVAYLANHNFRVVSFIMSGSTCVVFKLTDEQRFFAAKVIDHEKVSAVQPKVFTSKPTDSFLLSDRHQRSI